jgi:hypothetical protein
MPYVEQVKVASLLHNAAELRLVAGRRLAAGDIVRAMDYQALALDLEILARAAGRDPRRAF